MLDVINSSSLCADQPTIRAIPEFAVTGLLLAINNFLRDDLGNVRKPRKDAFAILVAQSAFHAEFFIKRRIDIVVTL